MNTPHPTPTPPANGTGLSALNMSVWIDDAAASSPLPLAGGAGGGQFRQRNTQRARELRSNATPAERKLWSAINRRQILNFKFSRQMPIGPYYADFLCRKAGLVVEVDGQSHDIDYAYDARRDAFLRQHGYHVLRVRNEDVLRNLDNVVMAISAALIQGPPPTPPASGRGE